MMIRPFFVVLIFTFVLSSCSNDSEGSDRGLTQDQLDAVSGMYNLSEYIVNPPQDLNNDGTFSQDLMSELDCLSTSIILRADGTYSKFYVDLNITFITNGLYTILCGDNASAAGSWELVNNQIILSEEPDHPYSLNDDSLMVSKNSDLPDFRSQVYLKQ